jgi:hypothetical protein
MTFSGQKTRCTGWLAAPPSVNCIFLHKKNVDTLQCLVALLLLIFILWLGCSEKKSKELTAQR